MGARAAALRAQLTPRAVAAPRDARIRADGARVPAQTLDSRQLCWQVKSGVFSRDSSMLAAAGATASIHVYDLPSYHERLALTSEGTVNALAFTADGLILASGGMDKKVRVWDTATGQCTQELVHDDYVLALAFAPGQRPADVRAPRTEPAAMPEPCSACVPGTREG